MGSVPNEKQSWLVPSRAAARFDAEQRKLMPIGKGFDVPGQARFNFNDDFPNGVYALRLQLLVASFRKNQPGLPVVASVEYNENPAATNGTEATSGKLHSMREMRKPEPQDIHRRRCLDWFKSSKLAQLRESPIRTDRERCANFMPLIVGAKIADTAYHSVFLDQLLYVGTHNEFKRRIPCGFEG